jgi:hypothetical protein
MVKYLNFHKSSFCLKILCNNVKGKATMWHTLLFCWLCLQICAGIGDKFFGSTTIWVTCGHSIAHIRWWMGSFHHALKHNVSDMWTFICSYKMDLDEKNLHPILVNFEFITVQGRVMTWWVACFVCHIERSVKPRRFMLHSWYLQKALND